MRDILGTLFAAAPGALTAHGTPGPISALDITTARKRLREALADRAHAEDALRAAQAHTERVRQLNADADLADRQAASAAAAGAEATKRWAATGARGDLPPEDQSLVDAAMTAKRRAEQLRLRANGASLALPDLEEAERAAGLRLESAGSGVNTAVAVVLRASIEPQLALLAQLQPQVTAALAEIRGLRLLVAGWGPANKWQPVSDPHVADEIRDRLRALGFVEPPGHDFKRAAVVPGADPILTAEAEDWFIRAQALLADPEAPISG